MIVHDRGHRQLTFQIYFQSGIRSPAQSQSFQWDSYSCAVLRVRELGVCLVPEFSHLRTSRLSTWLRRFSAQSHLCLHFESRAEGCYRTDPSADGRGGFRTRISEYADFSGSNGYRPKEQIRLCPSISVWRIHMV